MCSRRPLLAGKQGKAKMLSNRLVLGTLGENAGTPVEVVAKMHDCVTLNKDTNSVDKTVDKDPKNQHETTVESKEDKREEIITILNFCLDNEETAGLIPSIRSDAKDLLKLVAEVGVLQPLSSDDEAQLVILMKALDAIEQKINALQQEKDALQQQMQQEKDAMQQEVDAIQQQINANWQQINANR
jgi:hypothetical protein